MEGQSQDNDQYVTRLADRAQRAFGRQQQEREHALQEERQRLAHPTAAKVIIEAVSHRDAHGVLLGLKQFVVGESQGKLAEFNGADAMD